MFCVAVLPLVWAASIPDDVLTVSASIPAETLDVGGEYEIVLSVKIREGWTATKSGVPAPIVQVDVPASATLVGTVLTDQKELSRTDYLRAPFERLVEEDPTRIKFRLSNAPGADESFGLNVLAYVSTGQRGSDRFVRRRIRVPLAPKAQGVVVSPNSSEWGVIDTLQLGAKAVPFTLPRADGTKLNLSDFIGKKNVIVTTYRAFW